MELAKMLTKKSESGENKSLKDLWANYRKKEIQVEVSISKGLTSSPGDPEDTPGNEPEIITISKEGEEKPSSGIKKSSTEVEKIGNRIIKVKFTEYTGKRKKKVTHIEITEGDLEKMLKDTHNPAQAQFIDVLINQTIKQKTREGQFQIDNIDCHKPTLFKKVHHQHSHIHLQEHLASK